MNRGKEPVTLEVVIKGRKRLPPTYRRVFLAEDGRTWDTIAYEPPQDPGLDPWTIDIRPMTAQTVTIKTR